MRTKVQKWGNSQGIRLGKGVLEDAHLGVGEEVSVTVKDGVILVSPAKKKRGKYRLEDLTSKIPEDYQTGEYGWGPPTGEEVW